MLSTHDVENESQLAEDLGRLVRAFWSFRAPDGPPATCGSVQERDAATRRSIAQLDDELDVGATLAEWQDATRSDPFTGTPVWIHADLFPSNLLIRRRRLAAVIDFGDSGLGDPACDLLPAWSVLTSTTRSRFRTILGVDEPTWHRGRAMAFSKALRAVPYYRSSLPSFAAVARRTLAEVRADLASDR